MVTETCGIDESAFMRPAIESTKASSHPLLAPNGPNLTTHLRHQISRLHITRSFQPAYLCSFFSPCPSSAAFLATVHQKANKISRCLFAPPHTLPTATIAEAASTKTPSTPAPPHRRTNCNHTAPLRRRTISTTRRSGPPGLRATRQRTLRLRPWLWRLRPIR